MTSTLRVVIALQWDDIDEEGGVIHFRRRRPGKEIIAGVRRFGRKAKARDPISHRPDPSRFTNGTTGILRLEVWLGSPRSGQSAPAEGRRVRHRFELLPASIVHAQARV